MENFAKTIHHGSAVSVGVLSGITPQLDVSLLFRRLSRDFHSFYSNAFSENTSPQNESGIYMGWKYKFSKRHELAGYADLFQFPWLRFRGFAPSSGNEWLLRFTMRPTKEVHFFIQAREESKIRNLSTSSLFEAENGTKRSYWVHLDYAVAPKLNFKSRIQYSTFSLLQNHTSGFTIIQDINFDFKRFTFSGRYALFDTDDNDNRQYVYEKDVLVGLFLPLL